MKCTAFRIVLILLGLVALGLQIAGILVPYWIRFSMTLNQENSLEDTTVEINTGLFSLQWCEKDGECVLMTYKDMQDTADRRGGQAVELSRMALIQIVAIAAVAVCVLAQVLMILYVILLNREGGCCMKFSGVCSAIFWFISMVPAGLATVLIILVYIVQTSASNETVDVKFPWSVILMGIGAFLDLVIGIMVSVRLCKSRSTPGQVML